MDTVQLAATEGPLEEPYRFLVVRSRSNRCCRRARDRCYDRIEPPGGPNEPETIVNEDICIERKITESRPNSLTFQVQKKFIDFCLI